LGFALLACATTIHVLVDVDPDADFASLQSYAWISADPLIPQVNGVTQGGPPISPIDDKRIRTAVDNQLGAKGWQRVVERDEADLVVSYGVGATEKTRVYETPTGLGGFHGYRHGSWYAGSTLHTRQYTEGTLTVEFFSRRTKQAVWVGWASKRLSRSEDRQGVIERAVEKILRDFPSKP
jgi:hypothetical protein